jgi:pyridoxal phosphate enzyme (YggS family)
MSLIAEHIRVIKEELPSSVKLVAVSKSKPVSDIIEAYNSGQRYFGENRVQEILQKKDLLPDDIEWHLIGHLQSNKVKFVVPFINMIESVDSLKLLRIINDEATKIYKVVDCLLQIKIAEEVSKYGFRFDEITDMVDSEEFGSLNSVRICGVMGIGTFTKNTDKTRSEFRYLANCFVQLKNSFFACNNHFREISMGMSDDYRLALSEGSTIVRIGSLIFGKR